MTFLPTRGDLIEPYWNVKIPCKTKFFVSILDLIEPYWNVKTFVAVFPVSCILGFNRTILECKGIT